MALSDAEQNEVLNAARAHANHQQLMYEWLEQARVDRRTVVNSPEFTAVVRAAVKAELALLPPGGGISEAQVKAQVKEALKEGTS